MNKNDNGGEMQIATFYVGEMLLGVDICDVQEINRQRDLTAVPQTDECVRGVINLRGEVVTLLDLGMILDLGPTELRRQTRNMIVRHAGEALGLIVDSLADVVKIHCEDIEPPPANLAGLDARHVAGVYKLPEEIVVILKIDGVCAPRDLVVRN